MLEAVLLDVDGVLVDSQEANLRFFQKLLVVGGYDQPGSEAVMNCFHLTMYDAIARLTHSKDANEIKRVWQLGRDSSLYPMELLKYPTEIREVISELSDRYLLGIATSRIRNGMQDLLVRAGIANFFAAVVTFDDYTKSKPDPEPLLLTAKTLGVRPQAAVYVGDSNNDVVAAIAAGMKSVHLSQNPNPKADFAIRSFSQLPEAIRMLDADNARSGVLNGR